MRSGPAGPGGRPAATVLPRSAFAALRYGSTPCEHPLCSAPPVPLPSAADLFRRRRDDPPRGGQGDAAGDPPLPHVALSWLGELLHDAFAEPPPTFGDRAPDPAPDEEEDDPRVWRRAFLHRWRRLQLPEQLAAYHDGLGEAASAGDVHAVFAAHAAGLEPLFAKTGATALLVGRYAEGAAILVERRAERRFEAVDQELLATMAAQAEAALRRVALAGPEVAPGPGGVNERVERVLRYARAGAALGLEVTRVRVRLRGAAGAGEACEGAMRRLGSLLRREARGAGPALRTGEREYLLVLVGRAETAGVLVERIRTAVSGVMPVEAVIEATPHEAAPLTPSSARGG